VTIKVKVIVAVVVAVTMVVTVWSTFIFQGDEIVKGKGVVDSFQLVLEKTGSWSFLQVGA
jgi:hypothetical protein